MTQCYWFRLLYPCLNFITYHKFSTKRIYHTEVTSIVTKKGQVKTTLGSVHSRDSFIGDYFDIQILKYIIIYKNSSSPLFLKITPPHGWRNVKSRLNLTRNIHTRDGKTNLVPVLKPGTRVVNYYPGTRSVVIFFGFNTSHQFTHFSHTISFKDID